jgi:hypothetical protein
MVIIVNQPISAVHYEDSPIRQGAGVVDVVQAIGGIEQFHVTPAKLSLNDTANFEKENYITIYNDNTEKDLTVYISHLPSLTATGYSLTNQSNFTPVEPVGLYAHNDSAASVKFSNSKLVVPKGKYWSVYSLRLFLQQILMRFMVAIYLLNQSTTKKPRFLILAWWVT